MASKTITATAYWDDGSEEDRTEAVTWTSSNESVATVENGVITAVSPGKCTVTAVSAEGLTAELAVTVPPKKTK